MRSHPFANTVLKGGDSPAADSLATGLLSLTFGGRGARPNDSQPTRPILFFVYGTTVFSEPPAKKTAGAAYRKKYPLRLMRNFGWGSGADLIDQRFATTQGYF